MRSKQWKKHCQFNVQFWSDNFSNLLAVQYYTTGNRNEDQLILEFENSEFHKTISIDSYEIETELLPFKIKEYRKKIEKIISQLNE